MQGSTKLFHRVLMRFFMKKYMLIQDFIKNNNEFNLDMIFFQFWMEIKVMIDLFNIYIQQIWFTTLTYHTVPDVAGRQIMQMLCVNIDVSIRICYCEKFKYCLLPKSRPIGPAACILMWPWKVLLPSHNGANYLMNLIFNDK